MPIVDVEASRNPAVRLHGLIQLSARVGDLEPPRLPLALSRTPGQASTPAGCQPAGLDGDEVALVAWREACVSGPQHSIEQHPACGFIVLSEKGDGALSPGVNGPGTDTVVMGRQTRLMPFLA